MQAILVDDRKDIRSELAGRISERGAVDDVVQIPAETTLSPRAIAAEVARQTGLGETVVFVNINLKCRGNARQDQAGVEVLKFLRLTERFDAGEHPTPEDGDPGNSARNAHCVLYSFQSVEQLLRERPSSLMICSDGVTFERLPSDFSELDLPALAKKKAPADDLDTFLRGEFTLPDERHSWANWWGLKQLYDVHRLVIDDADLEYPEAVKTNLAGLQATEGASIYGSGESELADAFDGDLGEKIRNARETLKKREIKIGHVDDRWDDGWNDILSRMIYPDRQGEVTFVKSWKPIGEPQFDELTKDERIEKAHRAIGAGFEQDAFDLILLDLRLFGERRNRYEVSELSGAKLLQKLRKRYKGVPVIMTTASNKAWSHQQLTQVGADGYWIKEGLDERRGPEGTVQNYLDLLRLVETATGKKYQFLKRFAGKIRELKSDDAPWWKHKRWRNGHTTTADPENVFQVLEESLLMLRSYLSEVEMRGVNSARGVSQHEGTALAASRNESFWVSAVMQQMSNIIEIVHDIEEGGSSLLYRQNRNDQVALYLMFIRNYASHEGWFGNLQFADVRFFAELLMLWLQNEQYAKGMRGNWKSSRQEWSNYDEYADDWGRDRDRSGYTGHRITRIYAQVYWWLLQENPRADHQLDSGDRERLVRQMTAILKRHRQDYASEWADIKSRLVDDDGNEVNFDARIRKADQSI